MNLKSVQLLVLFLIFSLPYLSAQNTPDKIFKNVTLKTIQSEVLGEERTLFIYIPENYSEEKKYPVLYLLDGDMIPTYSEALESTKNENIGEHIIVGIRTIENRNRDMIPVKINSRAGSGGSKFFLEFLTSELKRFIEENYNTNGFDIVYGPSNSGLFVVYALLEKPEAFDAYISSSTMIGHCPEFMYQIAKEVNPKSQLKNKILYIHYGLKDHYEKATGFIPEYSKMLQESFGEYLIFGLKALENEGHVPPGAINEGLKFIYSNR